MSRIDIIEGISEIIKHRCDWELKISSNHLTIHLILNELTTIYYIYDGYPYVTFKGSYDEVRDVYLNELELITEVVKYLTDNSEVINELSEKFKGPDEED